MILIAILCFYQVRATPIWAQPNYGNAFDRQRAAALIQRSNELFPDKELLYNYLEELNCVEN